MKRMSTISGQNAVGKQDSTSSQGERWVWRELSLWAERAEVD